MNTLVVEIEFCISHSNFFFVHGYVCILSYKNKNIQRSGSGMIKSFLHSFGLVMCAGMYGYCNKKKKTIRKNKKKLLLPKC